MFFAHTLNPYRLAGDFFHVVAILTLLLKFCRTRSSAGVSGKTQVLLALTYTLRYMDLWGSWIWVSYYNTLMKVFYIGISYIIVYLTYSTFRKTFDWEADSFKLWLLLLPLTVFAYLINHECSVLEVAWTWSIYAEAIALVPQLFMIWKSGKSESYIISYLLFMALYRGLYILNWVYRYYDEMFYDPISAMSGIIETFVALFGFLCVVSHRLANCTENAIMNKCEKSVYVIPLITGDGEKPKAKLNSHLPV